MEKKIFAAIPRLPVMKATAKAALVNEKSHSIAVILHQRFYVYIRV